MHSEPTTATTGTQHFGQLVTVALFASAASATAAAVRLAATSGAHVCVGVYAAGAVVLTAVGVASRRHCRRR